VLCVIAACTSGCVKAWVSVPAVPWPAGGVKACVRPACVPIAWCDSEAMLWSAWVNVAAGAEPVVDGRDAAAVDAIVPDGAEAFAADAIVPLGADPRDDATDPEGAEAFARDANDLEGPEAFATEATDPDGPDPVAAACEWLGTDAFPTAA
jgi:hypothetical protein